MSLTLKQVLQVVTGTSGKIFRKYWYFKGGSRLQIRTEVLSMAKSVLRFTVNGIYFPSPL